MKSLKTHMTRALLLMTLMVFSFDMISSQILSENLQTNLIELPFDAEEEEEKKEKDTESDKLLPLASSKRTTNGTAAHYFVLETSYATIPREIVTPPPE